MTACVFWGRTIATVLPISWLAYLLGFIVAIASAWSLYELIDRVTTRQLRQGICPACGGNLEHKGNAFYDGLTPSSPWEIFVYLTTVGIAVITWFVVSGT